MESSKPIWQFNFRTNPELESGKKYRILPASDEDKQKVIRFYSSGPVEGYEVSSVEVIYNPRFNRAFCLELERLQEKKTDNSVFSPNWEKLDYRDRRAEVMAHWEDLTLPFKDDDYPAVKLLPAWHGTRPELLDSIFRVGYSNLSYTDDGYFGKGLYSAFEAEYSYRVYYHGALIMNWVASFSAFPVISIDMMLLKGKNNYGNYDAHFVPVVPRDPNNKNENVYFPCQEGQKAKYHEIVVFQTSACLPSYLVQLQKTLLKNPSSGIKAKPSSEFSNLTWEKVFQMASCVVLDKPTQMLHLYFPVPSKEYWTTWQERMTEMYEHLKATVGLKILQQYKTPNDQIQILTVKETEELLGYYQTRCSQGETIESIDLNCCILINEHKPKESNGAFVEPNPHEKAYEKLVKALQIAAKTQHIESCLQTRVPLLPFRDDKYNSFLHLLAQTNFANFVELFLQWGFKLTDTNHFGDIALHYACGEENKVRDPEGCMAVALIGVGSPLDTKNKQGQTPLMVAAQCGHVGAARVLLKAGANATLVDQNSQTACQLAKSSGMRERQEMVGLFDEQNTCIIS